MRRVARIAGPLAPAFLAALLLAPQDARAVDECGTVSSSQTTATCMNQAYSSGIAYTGLTHAFTLELLGGAATTIANPAAGHGIDISTVPANTGNLVLTVGVSGGVAITASGRGSHGVHIDSLGSGDVRVTVSEGAAVASQYGPGLRIALGSTAATAATARIVAAQGGAISARRGLFAHVARSSAANEARAAAAQPAIDVTWTGTFAREAGKTEETDAGRFAATAIDSAMVVTHRGAAVEEATRYGRPAGIEAQVMSIADLVTTIARGDDPNALMSPAAQTALLTGMGSTTEIPGSPGVEARKTAIVNQFRKLVTATDFVSITGASGVDADSDGSYDDQEILDWLGADSNDRRTFLRDLLRYGLSEGEEKILAAVTTGAPLVFTGLPSFAGVSWYDSAWQSDVRAFLEKHNVGNIRVAVNSGAIDSRGDGLRAYYSTPHDRNGRIDVTIAAGTTVTGGVAGVYVANAGCPVADGCTPGGQGIRNQFVTVDGRVTGGSDAAVHLSGGGVLTVGRMGAVLASSSGRAILVNDPGPATIRIDGLVRGGPGADAAVRLTGGGSVTVGVNGRVQANDADSAIDGSAMEGRGEDPAVAVDIEAPRDPREIQDGISRQSADEAAARVEGLIVGAGTTSVTFYEFLDGVSTGHEGTVPLKNGRPDTSGLPNRLLPEDPTGPQDPDDPQDPGGLPIAPGSFYCDRAMDGRCRLYEALPSMLLSMNRLWPSWEERSAAVRDVRGAWAHVHAGGGRWKAASSTRPDLAYDWRRFGLRAGIEAEAEAADGARVGVMVHVPRGSATMPANGGAAQLSGVGVGAYATALSGGFHLDVQAMTTWFEVDLASGIHLSPPLASDVSGTGYALGVEIGRRMAPSPDVSVSPRVSVTPRVGLVWSRVSLEDFTDSVGSRARVSVERAESLSGRIGVAAEAAFEGPANARLFASLDAAHAFSTEMETVVEGQTLRPSAKPTSVRFGWGGAFDLGERTSLRASMGYELGGGGHVLGGDLTLTVRF